MQSTFFLKMMDINLTEFYKFKGQFYEHKSTVYHNGIRGSKQNKQKEVYVQTV